MTIPVTLSSDIQKLTPSAIIELFEMDATSLGGDLLRFHAGTNKLSQNIVWQGNTYVRYPIHVSGFEYNGQGQFPRPKLQVSNVMSAITTIVLAHNDLLGAKITRKRTLAKYLDAVNFTGAVNPNADPTAAFEDDVYYIDRKSNEDRDVVEFELASAADLVNVKLPNRQIVQNVCVWKYRGAECGYTGGPLYDQNDERITTAASAQGTAFLSAASALESATTAYNLAVSALATASRNKDAASDYKFVSESFDYSGFGVGDYFVSTSPYITTQTARYAGSNVTLGSQYRIGAYKYSESSFFGEIDVYGIQLWSVDTAALSAATTAYNTALSNKNAAASNLATAQSNYNAALAALPLNDGLYRAERCGKRLSSCKIRFGANSELPFGAFPSVGLIK